MMLRDTSPSVALYDDNTHLYLLEIDDGSLVLCHFLGNTYDLGENGTLIIEGECDLMEGII